MEPKRLEKEKYPYCAVTLLEPKEFLSEKICRNTIRVRKTVIIKIKWGLFYAQILVTLSNNPLKPSIGMGFSPIVGSSCPSIIRDIGEINSYNKKKIVIAQVTKNSPEKIYPFTDHQIDEFYELTLQYLNNSISQEELLLKLRGGDFDIPYWFSVVSLVGAMIIVMNNLNLVDGFQVNRGGIRPPHHGWIPGNNPKPGNSFESGKGAGPRSVTVEGVLGNHNSNSYDYDTYDTDQVSNELEKQSHRKTINIKVADEIYIFENEYINSPEELIFVLAERVYKSIRESNTDIDDIAQNLGFKQINIKNLKDHVFYSEHYFDGYVGEEPEIKRFDALFEQAIAWKRLESGRHTEADVSWLKHECAERHHELKYGSTYEEAHKRAESRYKGYPWDNANNPWNYEANSSDNDITPWNPSDNDKLN
uniref:Uncharacterized protein n=1 Tax=Eunotia naegelii TaxID=1458866 RepID=A0A023JEP5_9STRA|nr:hypothetical protein [Eunotia naegelii]YP_009059312.1 hypothetical protein [Eunotia naegelii]AHI51209.1 hypothetical protein [Eunotia naegelii]AHI51259.1 hypothetical protein [Eunotia naegelii]